MSPLIFALLLSQAVAVGQPGASRASDPHPDITATHLVQQAFDPDVPRLIVEESLRQSRQRFAATPAQADLERRHPGITAAQNAAAERIIRPVTLARAAAMPAANAACLAARTTADQRAGALAYFSSDRGRTILRTVRELQRRAIVDQGSPDAGSRMVALAQARAGNDAGQVAVDREYERRSGPGFGQTMDACFVAAQIAFGRDVAQALNQDQLNQAVRRAGLRFLATRK